MARAPDAPRRPAALAAAVVAASGRRPWLALAACGVLVVASVWVAVARLEYRTQRNDLLSAEKECQKRWQRYLDAFGDDDDLIVVIRGSDRPRMTAAADQVAAELAARPHLFDRVFHRVDLRPLYARSLLFLPAADIAALSKKLDGMSPLLGRLGPLAWQALSLESLAAQGAAAAEAKATGKTISAADRDLLAQLPAVLTSAAAAARDPAAYRNPWALSEADDRQAELKEPQYFFTPDGALALVLARPVKASGSFTPAKEANAAARAVLADVNAAFPDLALGLTGLPVLETDEMVASDEDSTFASWLALAGVAGLYFVAYRGFRYPLLTVGTLLVGTAWALGWATLTVGHLNILSATFAVMIIGMGDYGVLWVARYDAERAGGRTVGDAMRETAAHAGPGIVTAAVTTALAFFATMFADFRAVAELGWIAGCGVLCCAAACLTFLPATLTLVERASGLRQRAGGISPAGELVARGTQHRPADAGRSPSDGPPTLPFPRPFLPLLAARPRFVLAAGALVLLVLGGFATRVRYDANLLNMQARGLDSVTWEHELVAHAAGATWDALSIARTPDEAARLRAAYQALPGVSRVIDAAALIPADQPTKLPLVADIHRRLADVPAPDAVPPGTPSTSAGVASQTARLAAADPVFAPLADALQSAPADRLAAFDARLKADLAGELGTLRAVSHPTPVALADLPPAFRERYVGANGELLVRAFAAGSLWEYDALERFTAAAVTVDPDATGKSFRTLEGLRQMKSGFARAGALALVVIVVVLWIDVRGWRPLLLGLFPLAAGVVGTLGVMGLLGLPLNPANLIALPLVVGVGVDNGVHVLHDYAGRRRGVAYRLGAATGRGILVAALTTVLGFGTLALARHRGMAGLGLALALGVSFCMAAALVLLPAALRVMNRTTCTASPVAPVFPNRRAA